MARIEDIERRLQNWARWKLGIGGGGLGYGSGSAWDVEVRSGYREAVIPTVDCEAEETDQAVERLESRLRVTVHAVYVDPGSGARKAAALGIAESSLYARVEEAHRHLSACFSERQRNARQERTRIEHLQRERAHAKK